MIYRRFGYIHARILLQKQDELKEIEDQLRIMDEEDENGGPRFSRCLKSRAHDERRARDLPEGKVSRKMLLRRAEEVVGEYGMLIILLLLFRFLLRISLLSFLAITLRVPVSNSKSLVYFGVFSVLSLITHSLA
jgi:hypothetical protein